MIILQSMFALVVLVGFFAGLVRPKEQEKETCHKGAL
jgi:hypothetical protein